MGTRTRIVSFSELDAIRQCRYKWKLAYHERWKTETEAEVLSTGRLMHEVFEAHYRRILAAQRDEDAPVDAAALYAHVGPMLYDSHTGQQSDRQALVEWMYRGYVDYYKLDPDWTIVAVEHPVEEWLPTPRGTRSSFRLKGKIDLVVRDKSTPGSGLWIVDHKSGKDLPKGKDIDLDDQFALYEWLLRRRGNNIRGTIRNAVRTTRLKTREMDPKERFKREYTVRSMRELTTVAEEAYEQFHEAYRGLSQGPTVVTPDTVTAGVTRPPRSPSVDLCRWRCPFTEPCLAARKGGDIAQLLGSTGFHQDFERH